MVKILYINTALNIMLTYRDLKAIQEGNRRNQDVMDLLREVKRLRQYCVEAYVFMGHWSINDISEENHDRLRRLRDGMANEPCIIEHQRMVQKQEDMDHRRHMASEQNRSKNKG